jgi:Icc-related predicted phosphoesterase
MRVAAIYDIHANLPALEAVLQDIRQAEVDQVVVGGDAARVNDFETSGHGI